MGNFKHIKPFNENNDLTDQYKEWQQKNQEIETTKRKYTRELTEEENLLIHAVLTEMKTDLYDGYYESVDGLIELLIKIPDAKNLLMGFLGDETLEEWRNGQTTKLY